jgi:hypothetical protein
MLCTNYVYLLEKGGGREGGGSVTHDVVTKSINNLCYSVSVTRRGHRSSLQVIGKGVKNA